MTKGKTMDDLIRKQIDELRAYAADRKGELAKLIDDAANTIEILSERLYTSQEEFGGAMQQRSLNEVE